MWLFLLPRRRRPGPLLSFFAKPFFFAKHFICPFPLLRNEVVVGKVVKVVSITVEVDELLVLLLLLVVVAGVLVVLVVVSIGVVVLESEKVLVLVVLVVVSMGVVVLESEEVVLVLVVEVVLVLVVVVSVDGHA